ncbi:BON domain-containing protein [Hymenobacter sp. CRA2]|uniref:BON domain-containing protein n=1 Tax=Hymenobacter sp. CRA2 TaxID=1955620 RepID=UPI00098E932D|nr:BON domain-containing protein [Hymenobacter sp. CRA2]OON69951.1 hypothetical protein B0919_04165 [Hymenobacter sp. CRA2]
MKPATTLPAPPAPLADLAITAAVERLFTRQRGISAAFINVATHAGIVMLTGFTDHLLGRDRAEEVAKAVRGVRGVINNVEVRTPDVSDEVLRQDVAEALATNPATHPLPLTCRAQNGVVELRGTVRNWAERQLALHVAKGVRGICQLTDHLEHASRPVTGNDERLATEIRELLRWNVRVHAGLVSVEVRGGRVTLGGGVGSAAERSEVVGMAWAAGAGLVDSLALRVDPELPPDELRRDKYAYHADADIARALRDALRYDPRVVLSEPEVAVHNGLVTLRGAVSSLGARLAAEQDARGIVGVLGVRNLLTVCPPELPADPLIRRRVQAALRRDPYLHDVALAVQVRNGWVSLSGTVGTRFETARAERVASQINGVVHVENHLQLPAPVLAQPDDAALADAIRHELHWNTFLHDQPVQVTVNHGRATLRGTVEDWHRAQMVVHCAYVAGARAVNDQLRIREELPL